MVLLLKERRWTEKILYILCETKCCSLNLSIPNSILCFNHSSIHINTQPHQQHHPLSSSPFNKYIHFMSHFTYIIYTSHYSCHISDIFCCKTQTFCSSLQSHPNTVPKLRKDHLPRLPLYHSWYSRDSFSLYHSRVSILLKLAMLRQRT